MSAQEKRIYLEEKENWLDLRDEFEAQINSSTDTKEKANLHFRLGLLLDEKFWSEAKALKHFQDAYKLDNQLLQALNEARRIYWELGKLSMVQKLVELELRLKPAPELRYKLLIELGHTVWAQGNFDSAIQYYTEASQINEYVNNVAHEYLNDAQVREENITSYVESLLNQAKETSKEQAVQILLRVARVLRKYRGLYATKDMLIHAYKLDPFNRECNVLIDQYVSEQNGINELETIQHDIVDAESNEHKSQLALMFARHWALRYQQFDKAALWLEKSVEYNSANTIAIFKLMEFYYGHERWEDVVRVADRFIASKSKNNASIISFAGVTSWQRIGDLNLARRYFLELSKIDPTNTQFVAFENLIGEKLKRSTTELKSNETVQSSSILNATNQPLEVETPDSNNDIESGAQQSAETSITISVSSIPPEPAALETKDAEIESLRVQLAKFEQTKRWGDVAKTLIALSNLIDDPSEKLSALLRAADLYANQLRNQVEAIKVFEQVRSLDDRNSIAIEFLSKAYENRRDYEKLISLRKFEIEQLPSSVDKTTKLVELAKLASEKVKKPDVNILYWNDVLESDPSNIDAITQLSNLYERTKDFPKLASTFERELEIISDTARQLSILKKLGILYSDKLQNDVESINIWRRLLVLDPTDKQAQEALKKKYLALQLWDELEVFYEESGKWDEFIRVLEQQEAKEIENSVKIPLLFKIAQLWTQRKQKQDRSIKAYEKILELDPNNVSAADLLIPIYQSTNNYNSLAKVFEIKVQHTQEVEIKYSLLRGLGLIYETKVKKLEFAFSKFMQAFEFATELNTICEDVERVGGQLSQWDAILKLYRNAVANESNHENRIIIRLRLGRIYQSQLKDINASIEQYQLVYQEEPGHVEAFQCLEQLYRNNQHYRDLLNLYQAQRGFVQDQDLLMQLLDSIGQLYANELNEPQNAIEIYTNILSSSENDIKVLFVLSSLYQRVHDWPSYIDILNRQLELTQTEETIVEIKFNIAQTLEHQLLTIREAIHQYREILQLSPLHMGSQNALENLLNNPEFAVEVASILEAIYEGQEQWNPLIHALEILAQFEKDDSSKIDILRKISRISNEILENAMQAFDAQLRALTIDPTSNEVRQELEEIGTTHQLFNELVQAFEGIVNRVQLPEVKREYLFKIAHLYSNRLKEYPSAIQAYHQILSINPLDVEALNELELLYEQTYDWKKLVEVLQRKLDSTETSEEKEKIYFKIASIYDEKLKSLEEAIVAHQEILLINPISISSLSALDRLFTETSRWDELIKNLENRILLSDTSRERVEFLVRLANLQEQKKQDLQKCIEIYEKIFEEDSTHEIARINLERLWEHSEYELQIAHLLEPLYQRLELYEKLVQVYQVFINHTQDHEQKINYLQQIAQIYEEQLKQPSIALDTFARAFVENPLNEDVIQNLHRLSLETHRWNDVAILFTKQAQLSADVSLSIHLYSLAAQIYDEQLQDTEHAIVSYRNVIGLDPYSIKALESLERLFKFSEQWEELSLILQKKSDVFDALEDKKIALFAAAILEEEVLRRPEYAIRIYQKILESDSEDERALEALAKHYLELKRWNELLTVYQRKFDLAINPDDKKHLLYQIGTLWERELNDPSKAIEAYQQVLEIDSIDLTSLVRLDVLYQTTQRWNELLDILQRERDLSENPNESLSFQYRIAELYEIHLNDPARAIELYRELLQLEPSHVLTLQRLETLKEGSQEPLAAARVLESVYEGSSQWLALISTLEVQIKYVEDEQTKIDILHRIAQIYDGLLTSSPQAFDAYARAFKLNNADLNTIHAFEALAEKTNRWRELALIYDQELETVLTDPTRFIELALRVAQIYETRISDRASAIQRYEKMLSVEEENSTALQALDRLFYATEQWARLVDILAKEAELAISTEQSLEFRYRTGEIYELELTNVEQALQIYKEILNTDSNYEKAIQRLEALFASGVRVTEIGSILEPIYQERGSYEKIITIYETELAALHDLNERLNTYDRIAKVYEEKLFDGSTALLVYARALKEVPMNEHLHDEAHRIAGMIEGYDTLANAYADVLVAHSSFEVTRFVGTKLAKTFEDHLHDVEKAEETYRYILGVGNDAHALENLDRIYTQWGAHEQLAQIILQRTKTTTETFELVELWSRLGAIYQDSLQKFDEAIEAYRHIFDTLEPSHEATIVALASLYARKQDYPKLLEVYERELANAIGDEQRAELFAKIAGLVSEHLNDSERAIELWKQVLELRGEDAQALDSLAHLYRQKERWLELVDSLERQALLADDDRRILYFAERAKLFTDKLNQDDSALTEWHRVLELNSEHVQALRAIADIHRKRGEKSELTMALQTFIERVARWIGEDELKEMYRELGHIYHDDLQQPIDAADAWRKLLEIDARDFEAMQALENIYRQDEQWKDVIHIKMMRAAALTDSAERVREFFEVSDLWSSQTEEPDHAVEANQHVLEIEPVNLRAFETLEQLHSKAERWAELTELYVHRLEQTSEMQERLELYRKIAHVLDEKLEDTNQAFDVLVNAFSEDFDSDETVHDLELLAHKSQRWADLLQTANTWLNEPSVQSDSAKKVSLMLRLAKWYGEDISKPEWAMPYLQQVQKLDPYNVRVRRQIANLHRKTGKFDDVGLALTQALEIATQEKDRKEICFELGELFQKQRKQEDQAIVYYQRALESDPVYQPAIDALETIFTSHRSWQDWANVLERKLAAQSRVPDLNHTRLELAHVYVNSLNELERAESLYREVLSHDSGNLIAIRGIKTVYQSTQNWPELVRVLELELQHVQTERERVDVLLQLASVLETHFLNHEEAAERLEQALQIDPTHEDAYRSLERCYTKLRKWRELVNTCQRHIDVATDEDVRIEMYAMMGRTFAEELDEVDSAIDAYRTILDREPNHVDALEALSRLYEKQGETAQSLEMMGRVADLTVDGAQRVEMLYRIGKAQDEKLGDRFSAQEKFRAALDLNPGHVSSIAALRQIALDTADWYEAAQLFEQEQSYTQSPRVRAKLLVELAKLREEMLTDHEGAIAAYELAYEIDNENEEAALPLVQEYVEKQNFERAEPLLESLTRKSSKREKAEQHRLFALLGQTLAALNKHERALKAYQQSFQTDPTDVDVIRGLARVCFSLEDWPTALSNYQKVLTHLSEDEIEARLDVYYHLGVIKHRQGQSRQAILNFEKALELDAVHRPTIDAMIQVYIDAKDWKQVGEYKRRILDNTIDSNERFQILIDIGDTWSEHDKHKAIEAYEEALELQPENHVLLHKLLAHYQDTQTWPQMINIVERICSLEPKAERKAKYYYTIAQLYRDKENNAEKAIEYFNLSLDQNPSELKAFEAINKIFTVQHNWKGLERAYRKMLHRVAGKGQSDLEFSLWHGLGLIYRDRMVMPDAAIEAFKMSSRLKPDEMQERQILAELYEQNNQFSKAIGEIQSVLVREPTHVEPYQSMYKLYMKAGLFDRAWCVSAALLFLGKADGDQTAFYEERKPKGLLGFRARVDHEAWTTKLFHPEQDKILSKIFEMVMPAARAAKLMQLHAAKQLPELPKKFLQDPNTTTLTFAKAFFGAAQILSLTPPQLYVRNDVPGALTFGPTDPPASIAGASVLSGFTPQELMFLIGKHLTYYRGEHYIKTLFPSQTELKTILLAAVKVARPDFALPAELAQVVSVTAQELAKYMQPVQLDGLRLVVKHFMDAGAKADLKRWMQLSDVTGSRVGFLLCGDLSLAAKLIRSEPVVAGDLSPAEKMKEVLLFSVSEEYFVLRQALGIAIQTETAP